VPLPILHHVERSASYVPPAYIARFARSLVTLALFGVPGVIAAIAAARRKPDDLGRRVRMALVLFALIIGLGALIAATDAMNDEGWNPTFYGGPFVAATLPACVIAATPREDSHRVSFIVIALILALPLALLISGLGSVLVQWASDHGLPLTW
jgi:hypothetical protein